MAIATPSRPDIFPRPRFLIYFHNRIACGPTWEEFPRFDWRFFNFCVENGDEGRLVAGEIEEGLPDGVFRGGDGGVSSGGVAAAGGVRLRRSSALFADSELHMRRMC